LVAHVVYKFWGILSMDALKAVEVSVYFKTDQLTGENVLCQ